MTENSASWIMVCTPDDIDIRGIYEAMRFFDVAQPAEADVQAGDIVYVFTDAVRYRCRITKTNMYAPMQEMQGFYATHGLRGRWSRGHAGYMRLEFLYRYDKISIRRRDLEAHGMDPGVTFCRVQGELESYLSDRDRIDRTMAVGTGYTPSDLPADHWSLPSQNLLQHGWELGSDRHVIRHTDDGFIRTAETYLAKEVLPFFQAEGLPLGEGVRVPLLYENELVEMEFIHEPFGGVRLALEPWIMEDFIEVYEETGAYPLATFYKMPPAMLESILSMQGTDTKLPDDEVYYLVLEDE